MIEKAFRKYGKSSFGDAIFYNQNNTLRIELSEGGSYINMFITAFNKALAVLNELFDQSDKVSICLSFYGDTFLSNLYSFRKLKFCEFSIPKKHEIISEYLEEDDITRKLIFFDVEKKELHKLLWGTLGSELGIQPSFYFKLYMFDIKTGVLAHPYDDRGMDIIGTNSYKISRIYKKFNNWLLEHDIQRMDRYYKYAYQDSSK